MSELNERTDEREAKYLRPDAWLFLTIERDVTSTHDDDDNNHDEDDKSAECDSHFSNDGKSATASDRKSERHPKNEKLS